MKLVLILGAILGLANALPLRSLSDDINEILALVPIDNIKAINAKYANDPEVQRFLAFFQSPEFLSIVETVKATPEYVEVITFLENKGLDVNKILDFVREILDFGTGTISETDSSDEVTRTFHGWFNEVRAEIPTAKIAALIKEKLATSSDFQDLVAALKSETFKSLVGALNANSDWQALLDKGREHGAPVDSWIARIYEILGW